MFFTNLAFTFAICKVTHANCSPIISMGALEYLFENFNFAVLYIAANSITAQVSNLNHTSQSAIYKQRSLSNFSNCRP